MYTGSDHAKTAGTGKCSADANLRAQGSRFLLSGAPPNRYETKSGWPTIILSADIGCKVTRQSSYIEQETETTTRLMMAGQTQARMVGLGIRTRLDCCFPYTNSSTFLVLGTVDPSGHQSGLSLLCGSHGDPDSSPLCSHT